MEARLELKLSQKLIMTPQLQQAIKLLQLSRLELVQSVSQELMENPVLEELSPDVPEGDVAESDAEAPPETPTAQEALPDQASNAESEGVKSDLDLGPAWDDYLNEMGDGRDFGHGEADDKELPSYDQTLTRRPSLSDNLLWQLRLSLSDPGLLKCGEWIIGNIDDDGYLRTRSKNLRSRPPFPPPPWNRRSISFSVSTPAVWGRGAFRNASLSRRGNSTSKGRLSRRSFSTTSRTSRRSGMET